MYTERHYKIVTRAGVQDIGVILDVWALDCYQASYIAEEDIVVDIGAHIGSFSLMAAKKAKSGKVFAFEPLPLNFSFLQANIKLNSLSNIFAFNKAVGRTSEIRRLFLQQIMGKPFNSAASFYANTSELVEVETTTLRDILNLAGRIDFLKIDTEGAEVEILFALERSLFKGIKRISLESHDYLFGRDIYKEIAGLLSEQGFEVETQTTLFANNRSRMLYARRL